MYCTRFSFVSFHFLFLCFYSCCALFFPTFLCHSFSLSSIISFASHLSTLCPSIKDPALLPRIQSEMRLQGIRHCRFGIMIYQHSITAADGNLCCPEINREISTEPHRTAFPGPCSHTCLSSPLLTPLKPLFAHF